MIQQLRNSPAPPTLTSDALEAVKFIADPHSTYTASREPTASDAAVLLGKKGTL